MIPLKDDNPQINIPYGTYIIIILNILTWIFIQSYGSAENLNYSICKYGLIPNTLLNDLKSSNCENLNIGTYFTILSSMFMHGGWMHIIGNLLFLWVFGGNVEDSMGTFRYIIFYTLCGTFAALTQVYTDMYSIIPMVGASGAIGGIMGAYLFLYPKVKVHICIPMIIFFPIIKVPAFFMLGYWILLQLLEGIPSIGSNSGGIAFWAHIGGYISGLILVYFFKDDELLTNHKFYGWSKSKDISEIWNDPDNKQ